MWFYLFILGSGDSMKVHVERRRFQGGLYRKPEKLLSCRRLDDRKKQLAREKESFHNLFNIE